MASEDSPFDVAPTDGNDDPLAGGMADVAISDDAGASPFEQAGAERKGTVDFEASHSSVDDGMTSYNDLLAPPSYEDSVAFEAPPAAEETAAPAAPSAAEEPESKMPAAASEDSAPSDLDIKVSDPLKQPDKDSLIGGTFVTYKIETATSLPQFKKGEFTVRRRFREFVALAERLDKSHRGYFIPPRPDKNVVEGKLHNTEFIEVRRVALQKYLQKLAKHPVLSKSKELQLFLEWEGDISNCGEWKEMNKHGWKEGLSNLPKQLIGSEKSIPLPEEASSKRDGRNLMRGFKEFRQKFKNKALKDSIDIEDNNNILQEEKENLKEMEVRLAAASAEAENMIKRMEKVADAFGDFGLSAIKTSKFEEDEGCRNGKYSESGEAIRATSVELKGTGTQAVRMSRLVRSATENTAAQLSHIHDYLGLMPATIGAMRDRDQAILTYQTLVNELKSKKSQIEKLEEAGKTKFGGDRNKTRKVHELNQDCEALEQAKEASYKEFQRIQERNVEELERFAKEKEVDFSQMLIGYAKVQAALAERTAMVWKDLGDDLKAGQEEEEEDVKHTVNPMAGA